MNQLIYVIQNAMSMRFYMFDKQLMGGGDFSTQVVRPPAARVG
jgi:hypothetical protein